MNLLKCLLDPLQLWTGVFPQQRTLNRAMTLAFGILCGVGKRTITRAICFHGNTDKDWTADYKVFSRSRWEARDLFHPIVEQAIASQKLDRIVVSIDDTRLWRNGKKIPEAQWHRDPLGPPFQTNLRWGHRFLQGSLVLPLYTQDGQSSSRSLPQRYCACVIGQKAPGFMEKPNLLPSRSESRTAVPRGKQVRSFTGDATVRFVTNNYAMSIGKAEPGNDRCDC